MIIDFYPKDMLFRKAQLFFQRAKECVRSLPIKCHTNQLFHYSDAIHEFFGSTSIPLTTLRSMVSEGVLPTRSSYLDLLDRISQDIDVVFQSQRVILDAMSTSGNFVQLQKNLVEQEVGSLKGLLQAALGDTNRWVSSNLEFVDNFDTASFLDQARPINSPTLAEVDTVSKTLTLKKQEVIPAIETGAEIEQFSYSRGVSINIGADSSTGNIFERAAEQILYNEIIRKQVYLGKMYGVESHDGKTSVEDGVRIDTGELSQTTGFYKALDDESRPDVIRSNSIWESELIVLDAEDNLEFTDLDGTAAINTDRVITNGGEWTELAGRRNIRVRRPPVEQAEIDNIRSNFRSLAGTSLDRQDLILSAPLSKLRFVWNQLPVRVGDASLSMVLSIRFREVKKVGAITITPHLFSKNYAPEVIAIRAFNVQHVNDDGTLGKWVDINVSGNIANGIPVDGKVFLDKVISWTFSNMLVSLVEVSLLQKNGYPLKYDLGIAARRDPTTNVGYLYLVDYQGNSFADAAESRLKAYLEDRQIPTLDPTAEPIGVVTEIENGIYPIVEQEIRQTANGASGGKGGKIRETLYKALESELGEGWDRPANDSPDVPVISKSRHTIPSDVSNRYRYSIGIRDLDISAIVYAERSEIHTVEWRAQYVIGLLSLQTVENIPVEILAKDPTRAWITYEVSLDKGNNFYEIAPIGNRPIFRTDSAGQYRVPTVIRVNSDIPADRQTSYPWRHHGFVTTDSPPDTVIMRIILERPTDSIIYEGMTPRLDAYRLVAGPATGASV